MLKNVVGLVTGGASGLGKVSLSTYLTHISTLLSIQIFLKDKELYIRLATFKYFIQEKDCNF